MASLYNFHYYYYGYGHSNTPPTKSVVDTGKDNFERTFLLFYADNFRREPQIVVKEIYSLPWYT